MGGDFSTDLLEGIQRCNEVLPKQRIVQAWPQRLDEFQVPTLNITPLILTTKLSDATDLAAYLDLHRHALACTGLLPEEPQVSRLRVEQIPRGAGVRVNEREPDRR